jgi:hypothetical protein
VRRSDAVTRGALRILAVAATFAAGVGDASAAKLGDNTVRLAPSTFRLPQNIGPLRFTGSNRYRDRRMGRSFAYATSGISLNIYVYDYGYRGLPEGPDSYEACQQYESAKREIERGGNYQNVELRSEVTRPMADTAAAPRAREALYEFDRKGIHALSLLWVTTADGYFVKLRLSLRHEVADELEEARAQVLAAISEAIVDARAGAREPGRARPSHTGDAPGPVRSGFDLEPAADPAESEWWLAYAIALRDRVQLHPATGPACGGTVEPDYLGELEARRAALRAFRSSGASSEDFGAMARVDDAGLLDEYVWVLLHRDTWGSNPPPDLELSRFAEFRGRELPGHVARTGARVRVDTVRTLPEAPAP